MKKTNPPPRRRRVQVINRNVSLSRHHVQLLEHFSADLPGGVSEFLRRLIDEHAARVGFAPGQRPRRRRS